MTDTEIMALIDRSLFAVIGYTDELGRQNIRRVFCVWHKGIGRHLISTNTCSSHVQSLLKIGMPVYIFQMMLRLREYVYLVISQFILKGNTRSFYGMTAMKNTIQTE